MQLCSINKNKMTIFIICLQEAVQRSQQTKTLSVLKVGFSNQWNALCNYETFIS